jgi:hypothetical protein
MRYLLFCIASACEIASSQPTGFPVAPHWQPYISISERCDSVANSSLDEVHSLGSIASARFLSTDLLADQYPGWTPYHYSTDCPIRFVDPTGKWVAEFDQRTNAVLARAEKDDRLEGLYSQLGLSPETFGKRFGISDMQSYEVVAGQTTFNISSHVLKNTQFDPLQTNSNCFGFVAVATGAISTETQVQGMGFMSTAINSTETDVPHTGDVAIWHYAGDIDGAGELGQINGTPAHAAIFVLSNRAGEPQFLNRSTEGAPVSITTSGRVLTDYASIREAKQVNINSAGLRWVLPSIEGGATYYKRK